VSQAAAQRDGSKPLAKRAEHSAVAKPSRLAYEPANPPRRKKFRP
jgi:hypothetical protein